MCLRMFLLVSMYTVHMQRACGLGKGIGSPEIGVTGACETLNMDSGN